MNEYFKTGTLVTLTASIIALNLIGIVIEKFTGILNPWYLVMLSNFIIVLFILIMNFERKEEARE